MGNTQRGEVTLEVLGKSYTLVLNLNAMCELEDLLSTPERQVTFNEALQQVMKNSVRHVRAFVWASLRQHHRDLTLLDAGQLVQEAGGLEAFSKQLASLATAAYPDAEDVKHAETNGRPQKAQGRSRAGTGTSLKSRPGASA